MEGYSMASRSVSVCYHWVLEYGVMRTRSVPPSPPLLVGSGGSQPAMAEPNQIRQRSLTVSRQQCAGTMLPMDGNYSLATMQQCKQTKMGLEKVDSKGDLTTFKAGQDVSLKPKYCPSLKELDLKKPNPA